MKTSTLSCSMLVRFTGTVIAMLGVAIVSSSARASEVAILQAKVRYGDLNLETETGAQALIARLNKAATKVCGGESTFQPLQLHREAQRRFEACQAEAVQSAVVTVDRRLVTQLYQSKRVDSRIAKR